MAQDTLLSPVIIYFIYRNLNTSPSVPCKAMREAVTREQDDDGNQQVRIEFALERERIEMAQIPYFIPKQ